ncbi:MAG: Asp-tRNA(Asn)/Glu-tRNA(Gln) amidotransferase subunit GatA [Candidatus Margulisbacteria bacterium]|nr:Asp-tRNA(Asn)/Glu-tRNA(Gln) amidotransferase subunit GatA [Candidatus Margulisiibacteriota bacterium]
MTFTNLTAHELSEKLNKKEIKATEVTEAFFEHIKKIDSKVKAYVTLMEEQALAQAKKVDEKIAKGEKLSALEGIPWAIKDNFCTKGTRTTCSSKILENYIATYDSSIVEKMNQLGAVPLGKTNLDEFAMGSSTENSGLFTTKNPWNLETVPGGSSGGSAAAVAADECVFALGSDTGGSIRQPGSFCGVVGLKPTYGRVSRYGLVAFASSLDQIGPLTKDVTDAAIVLREISGYDSKDSTSVNKEVPDYTKALTKNIKGLKIAVPKELMGEGINAEVKKIILEALEVYKKEGATVSEVEMPSFKYALSTYYLIAPAEASANLGRYDGVRYGYRTKDAEDLITMFSKTRAEGFGDEVKRRIMIGTYALSAGYYDAYYLKAQKVRTLIRDDFKKVFNKYDVIMSPTSPSVAFKIGERTADPLSMYLSDIATIPVNLAGLPGISIPCGFSQGLPVGLQIIARHFDEETMLKAAFAYEQATGWHTKRPKL